MSNKDLLDTIIHTIAECYKINKEIINEDFVDKLIGQICIGDNYKKRLSKEDKSEIIDCVNRHYTDFPTHTSFMSTNQMIRSNIYAGIQITNYREKHANSIIQNFSKWTTYAYLAIDSRKYDIAIPLLIEYMINNEIMGKIFIERTYSKYITLYILKENTNKIQEFCNNNKKLFGYHTPFINHNSPCLLHNDKFGIKNMHEKEKVYENFYEDTCKLLAKGIDYNTINFTDNIDSLKFSTNNFLNIISENMHKIQKEKKKSKYDAIKAKKLKINKNY